MDANECLIHIRFPSQPNRLRILRSVVQQSAQLAGCSKKNVNEIVLAVNEACMNIIQHAYQGFPYGDILLEIRKAGSFLEFRLTDFGKPVCVEKVKPRQLDDIRPGGLGCHFIREIMDKVDFIPLNGTKGNQLHMKKKIE